MDKAKHAKQSKPRSHNRSPKKLKRLRNEARRDLRREGQDNLVIQEIAKQFHKLIRMYSKAQKVSLRSKANLEARKARRECAKSLW